ncbi:hypothetical protein LTR62_003748 [Meristemomyces frigidus]|uniref:Uncharacterized protein n=1 Tax=Meristemomyces frigidus TaxID=1508187 RepID=A0AAN7TF50_9PEZI|nr:hypothetical protein LTR62_003748 [Meristemomyces frigidus]
METYMYAMATAAITHQIRERTHLRKIQLLAQLATPPLTARASLPSYKPLANIAIALVGASIQFPPSPTLLGIPPELRNMIYDFVLLSTIQEFRLQFRQHPTFPPILHVCRQLRNEALAIYFRNAEFEFIVHWNVLAPLYRYLNALSGPARVQLIRNKNFTIHVIFDEYHAKHTSFRRQLGHFSFAELDFGPYLTAESHESERAAITTMRSKAARAEGRKKRVEMAEKRAREDAEMARVQGAVVAVPDLVRLVKKVTPAVAARNRLHRELNVVWSEVIRLLETEEA